MILSQEHQPGAHPEPANIALEPNIDLRWVSRVIDQGLIFDPLRKRKGQKFTDLNIEKVMLHSKKLLSNLTQKTLNLHSLVTKRYLKWKKLYNSHNYVVYVLKKMRCLRKDYFAKLKPFPLLNRTQRWMQSIIVMYCWKIRFLKWTGWWNKMSICLCKAELEFPQQSSPLTCWNTRNRSPKLLEPHQWQPNNPDFNPVDFEI